MSSSDSDYTKKFLTMASLLRKVISNERVNPLQSLTIDELAWFQETMRGVEQELRKQQEEQQSDKPASF
jgi:hypothetical protein